MKLLILPSWYPNPMKPDFAPYVEEQARSLVRSGVEVTLVYSAPYSWKWVFARRQMLIGLRERREEGFREIIYFLPKTHIRSLDQLIRDWLGKRILRRLLDEGYRPDAVHLHTYEAGNLGRWVREQTGTPFVYTEHYTGFARGIVSRRELKLARRTAAAAAERLAVSEPFKEILESRLGYPFRVVPNYIDTGFFCPDETAPKEYDFLCVGHLLPKKNHIGAIRALAELKKKGTGYSLGIIGEGPERGRLEAAVRTEDLGRQVTLLGYRDRVGVRDLLRRSRFFLFPSLVETFGIAPVEAMACGLPALVTRSGGPETLVAEGETGVISNPDPLSLAEAMEGMAKKAWDRYAIRDYAVERWSEAVVCAELRKIYESL